MEKMFDIQSIVSDLEKLSLPQHISDVKVSIIVPTYNNEKYLSKCLMSLVQQTLKEIEIIVVNDGSTDRTSEILDEFSKVDKRIKIINQQNKKQGAARNSGMKVASGEYIGFVDSDDWVDLDYYEKLYNAAKKNNSDIALATNVRIGNGKTKKRLNITEEKIATSLQEKIDIGNQAKNPCPTNKIYRKSMLIENNIDWPEGIYCEDKLFTIKAIYSANSIVSVPSINYYYFRNPNSTVNKKDKFHIKQTNQDKENAKIQVLNFLREKNADIKDKEFWATTKKLPSKDCPLVSIKESLKTKRICLFGCIKIAEFKIK